ncbi:YkgJ family cysteine cluster protein [Methanocella arvoryzae]|uniref:YkgJ family cysteine cluster protein n=1 Tax=Methanocella arvoryzae (strain DSM 22066 / NBRC 105507 / MRE50) TaxID=351160 RepID=Q0W7Y1_METAR|nr:YkgJ family cysteine cluster protein [Methanocella arvoryzae]CAJ35512.1 hypothetical protein LRC585 [Methanocella arvoryzae MRE50]
MPGCTQCGSCCLKYGMRLEATPLDLARWTLDGRQDILSRVGVDYDEKGEVTGGRLWINPDGSPAAECPFMYEKEGKYYCGIHEIKPEVCVAHICIKYYGNTN